MTDTFTHGSEKPFDPSANVKELVEASIKRLDDIAEIRSVQVNEKIHDKDIQYQLQFAHAKEAFGIALVAQEKAVAAAFEGTREAINKADVNTDKRFDLLSEKIDGITTIMNKTTGASGIYVTHSDLSEEMEKLRTSFESMLRPVVTFMNSQTGKIEQSSLNWTHIVGAVGIISTVILLGLRLMGK